MKKYLLIGAVIVVVIIFWRMKRGTWKPPAIGAGAGTGGFPENAGGIMG